MDSFYDKKAIVNRIDMDLEKGHLYENIKDIVLIKGLKSVNIISTAKQEKETRTTLVIKGLLETADKKQIFVQQFTLGKQGSRYIIYSDIMTVIDREGFDIDQFILEKSSETRQSKRQDKPKEKKEQNTDEKPKSEKSENQDKPKEKKPKKEDKPKKEAPKKKLNFDEWRPPA